MEALLDKLNSLNPLSTGLRMHLVDTLCVKTIKKGKYLLQAGKICSEICFIERGLLRSFRVDEDSEVCKWFMMEGDIAIAIQSFFLQVESQEYIEALEDTTVQFLSYKDLQDTYRKFPEFNVTGRVITEMYYCLSEDRLDNLRGRSAIHRYSYMLQNYPDILKRVPSKYLASYLGMKKEHLSAVKRKLKNSLIHNTIINK